MGVAAIGIIIFFLAVIGLMVLFGICTDSIVAQLVRIANALEKMNKE